MFVGTYFQAQGLPDLSDSLLRVRTAYLQDLLNHTKEDSPNLAFEDYLPEDLPTQPL